MSVYRRLKGCKCMEETLQTSANVNVPPGLHRDESYRDSQGPRGKFSHVDFGHKRDPQIPRFGYLSILSRHPSWILPKPLETNEKKHTPASHGKQSTRVTHGHDSRCALHVASFLSHRSNGGSWQINVSMFNSVLP